MPDILLDGRTIAYALRRSVRRTVGLKVDGDGLTVTVPQRMAQREVQEILERKARWILAKLAAIAAQPAPASRSFADGEMLPYRGGFLTLAVRTATLSRRTTVIREGDWLIVEGGVTAAAVERAVRVWYRHEAAALFAERIACYAPLVGKAPARVTVKDQQRRWGSCSAQGAVALNWRLVLAPPPVADFVVVHELCHLQRMDHSPAFWQLVAGILPAYKEPRAWLRAHGGILVL